MEIAIAVAGLPLLFVTVGTAFVLAVLTQIVATGARQLCESLQPLLEKTEQLLLPIIQKPL